jgi:hypothetical protein
MKKLKYIILSLISLSLILLNTAQLLASEIDSFSQIYNPLNDSQDQINQFTNQELEKVIDFVNSYSSTCSEDKLYRAIKHHFASRPQNTFRRYLIKSDSIDKRRVKINQSVFKNLTFVDSFVVGGLSRLFNLTGYEFRVGQYNIGSDKFAHFFNKGWKYYKRYYQQDWPIEEVLASGFKQEIRIYGFTTTGIASFGDLAANFSGLRFWNDVLGKNPDILNPSKKIKPLIECRNSQWVKVKEFDWMKYVNASWDETYNCSLFLIFPAIKK